MLPIKGKKHRVSSSTAADLRMYSLRVLRLFQQLQQRRHVRAMDVYVGIRLRQAQLLDRLSVEYAHVVRGVCMSLQKTPTSRACNREGSQSVRAIYASARDEVQEIGRVHV